MLFQGLSPKIVGLSTKSEGKSSGVYLAVLRTVLEGRLSTSPVGRLSV
jgi:hypothetical protein